MIDRLTRCAALGAVKKLLCPLVLAAAALVAVPAVVPAPARAAAPAGFQEFVVGPFELETRAHDEAESLRGRGFRAEVYFVPGRGWMVRAWRRG